MKIDEIEELINHYTNDLKKVIGDIHNGKQNIKFPSFDFDIVSYSTFPLYFLKSNLRFLLKIFP